MRSRRAYLIGTATALTGSVAGCAGILGDDGSDEEGPDDLQPATASIRTLQNEDGSYDVIVDIFTNGAEEVRIEVGGEEAATKRGSRDEATATIEAIEAGQNVAVYTVYPNGEEELSHERCVGC